jgi:protein SCO1/2
MKYYEILLALTILSAGIGVSHRDSMAMASETGHHQHGMTVPGAGYKRAIVPYQTPDVKLVDAKGKPVSLRSSLDGGDPVMLNFIFTTCTTICPVTSATFSMVQEKLGPEHGGMRLVSISIDPEHDTPSRLNAYAKTFGAGAQWSILTGSFEDSIAVQRAFDAYTGDKMNHRPVTFMRKGPGKPWLRIDGFASADDLLQEYRKLASN